MLLTQKKKNVRIGPEDNGRRMRLDDYEYAIVEPGYRYELAKGVIQVSDIPKLPHGKQLQEISRQLLLWSEANPGLIEYMCPGNGAKLLIAGSESERRPDWLIYLSSPPDLDDPWSIWIPEIVIEVVSDSSAKRDYEEKPPEYLELGVKENWIVDKRKNQMLALIRWRGQWQKKTVKPPQKYTSDLLPGFKLDLKRVFAAAK